MPQNYESELRTFAKEYDNLLYRFDSLSYDMMGKGRNKMITDVIDNILA